jgi:tight adherence protein C
MAFFIAVFAFIAVALMVMGVFLFLREQEEQTAITRKVMNYSENAAAADMIQEGMALPEQPAARFFTRLIRYFGNLLKPEKKEEISLIQKRFLRAGLRNRNALVIFFGAKALCAIGLSMSFVAAMFIFGLKIPLTGALLLIVLLCFLGFLLPNVWLAWRTSRRKEQIMSGFPDALDLLAICVEAGMGLDAAIKRVGEEMRFSNATISNEFQLLNLEMRAGKDRREAMKSMSDRIDLEDVSSWVSLLIQTDRLGTSISQALRIQSDSLRTKRSQRLEEIAAKVPVKLLFPTIFCIFPALFVVILGPAVIRILRVLSGS